MNNSRPRRFFGLLCAHEWEIIGEATYGRVLDARKIIKPILQCKHCGDVRTAEL